MKKLKFNVKVYTAGLSSTNFKIGMWIVNLVSELQFNIININTTDLKIIRFELELKNERNLVRTLQVVCTFFVILTKLHKVLSHQTTIYTVYDNIYLILTTWFSVHSIRY